MGTITLSLPVAHTSAAAGQIAGDLTTIQTVINGGLDNNNLAAGFKRTTSAYSGGPPASPSDGDIWIATGVNTISITGARWQFQYDATNLRWDFIGGPPITSWTPGSGSNNAVLNTYSNMLATLVTIVRAGSYTIWGSGQVTAGAAAMTTITAIYVGTVSNTLANTSSVTLAGSGYLAAFVNPPITFALSAGDPLGISGQSAGANAIWSKLTLSVQPVYIT